MLSPTTLANKLRANFSSVLSGNFSKNSPTALHIDYSNMGKSTQPVTSMNICSSRKSIAHISESLSGARLKSSKFQHYNLNVTHYEDNLYHGELITKPETANPAKRDLKAFFEEAGSQK